MTFFQVTHGTGGLAVRDSVAHQQNPKTYLYSKKNKKGGSLPRPAARTARNTMPAGTVRRLNQRYGIGKPQSDELVAASTTPGGGGAGAARPSKAMVAVADGGASAQPADMAAVHQAAQYRQTKRDATREEVERLRGRLARVENRNGMALEKFLPPDELRTAQDNLAKLKLNTTGYLAQKVVESKAAAAKLAEETAFKESAVSMIQSAADGALPQVEYMVEQELQTFVMAGGARADFRSELANRPDADGRTPLHYAACYGHRAVVEVLTGAGCDPAASDNDGYTALHFASRWDRLECAEYLVWLEAVEIDPRDKFGQTPLVWHGEHLSAFRSVPFRLPVPRASLPLLAVVQLFSERMGGPLPAAPRRGRRPHQGDRPAALARRRPGRPRRGGEE
eukprot:SAG22_NODE_177_length_16160_cov_41.299296_2_plen_394_part_00